jgi:hypothetical protein
MALAHLARGGGGGGGGGLLLGEESPRGSAQCSPEMFRDPVLPLPFGLGSLSMSTNP